ncbi:DivIVA domain-containing protein [Actinoplanes derwentensis]|uniref:Cell wall synthesis protein Wag31 n=1 Tax=Actinoplanes derwentensis TaxID=113562 RepID=A0A1H1SZV6_9ACTN|nr:DivIVA domain-containing protein [Actinoplanes derwentensis]GID90458.1 cell division initiation protein [Actinoplanes derwentensis]SDS53428.1 DivIVA domain-containing protein [Actinoplanes derwentensis]
MPLTPADIHNVSFTKPAVGRGAYVEEEVDAFLDEAERELARLLTENGTLRTMAVQHGDPPGDYDEVRALAAHLQRMEQERDFAEQNARELRAELDRAHQGGPRPGPGSGEGNLRVLAMAQRTADEHLRDAQRESEGLIADARDRAGQLAEEVQARAAAIESEAVRRHADALDGLAVRRATALDEIQQLTSLAGYYREALRRHVAGQLADVDNAPMLGPT